MGDETKSTRRPPNAQTGAQNSPPAEAAGPSSRKLPTAEPVSKASTRIDIVKPDAEKGRVHDLPALHKALAAMHSKLAHAESELGAALKDRAADADLVGKMLARVGEREEALKATELRASRAEERADAAANQARTMGAKIEGLSAELSSLRASMQLRSGDSQTRTRTAEEKVVELTRKIEHLQVQLVGTEEKARTAEERALEGVVRVHELQSKVVELEARSRAGESRATENGVRAVAAEEQLAQQISKVKQLEAMEIEQRDRLEATEAEKELVQSRLDKIRNELESTKRGLESEKSSVKEAIALLEHEQTEAEKLRSVLGDSEATLRNELDEARAKVAALSAEIAEHEKSLATLRAQHEAGLATKQAAHDESLAVMRRDQERSIESLERSLEDARNQSGNMTKLVGTARAERLSLAVEVASLRGALATAVARTESLERQLDSYGDLTARTESLLSTLERREQDLSELRSAAIGSARGVLAAMTAIAQSPNLQRVSIPPSLLPGPGDSSGGMPSFSSSARPSAASSQTLRGVSGTPRALSEPPDFALLVERPPASTDETSEGDEAAAEPENEGVRPATHRPTGQTATAMEAVRAQAAASASAPPMASRSASHAAVSEPSTIVSPAQLSMPNRSSRPLSLEANDEAELLASVEEVIDSMSISIPPRATGTTTSGPTSAPPSSMTQPPKSPSGRTHIGMAAVRSARPLASDDATHEADGDAPVLSTRDASATETSAAEDAEASDDEAPPSSEIDPNSAVEVSADPFAAVKIRDRVVADSMMPPGASAAAEQDFFQRGKPKVGPAGLKKKR